MKIKILTLESLLKYVKEVLSKKFEKPFSMHSSIKIKFFLEGDENLVELTVSDEVTNQPSLIKVYLVKHKGQWVEVDEGLNC